MSKSLLVLLLADSASRLPLGKGIAMIVFFGSVGVFATKACFSPSEKLAQWSHVIGTQNPTASRIVCIIGAIVGWGAVAITLASLSGALD